MRGADRLASGPPFAASGAVAFEPANDHSWPSASLELDVVRTESGLHALEREWTALHRSEAHNPFLSHQWTEACWANRQRTAELFVCTARSAGALVAVAPLCIESWNGLRTLRFIADERSDYLGFLCRAQSPDLEQRLLALVLGLDKHWDLASLERLAPDYSVLGEPPLPSGFEWERARTAIAPFCAWDGDWDSLHRDGPAWFREMRKRRRRFAKDGAIATRLTGMDAVRRLDCVAAIERQSWKAKEGAARLQPGPGQEILRRAFESPDGPEMQLWLAEHRGRGVAYQIDFLLAERLFHYQCAFDARFASLRAGSVLAYLSLENGWRRGIREFDYLTGDEPYKLQRTNAARPIYRLAVHRRTARGLAAYWLLVGIRSRLRRLKLLRAAWRQLRIAARAAFPGR